MQKFLCPDTENLIQRPLTNTVMFIAVDGWLVFEVYVMYVPCCMNFGSHFIPL